MRKLLMAFTALLPLGCEPEPLSSPGAGVHAWVRVARTGPSDRYHVAMAYDAHRGRTVLFGGAGSGPTGLLDETWEWDGATWTRMEPNNHPTGRTGSSMVYDPVRQRVVLYAGYDGTYTNDTWEWDGVNWTLVASGGPEPRTEHAMAWDAARQRIVMFGGYNDEVQNDDTWEWDGQAWTRVATEGPQPRVIHAMEYDPVRNRIVLFGGKAAPTGPEPAPGYLQDTWEWDGAQWTEIDASGPIRRVEHRMFYDLDLGKIVLYGGKHRPYGDPYGWPTMLNDTWTWDGASWVELDVDGPIARTAFGLAYDSARRRAAIFGGYIDKENPIILGDTWEFGIPKDPAWTDLAVAGPSARSSHAMAYDRARDRVVLFGGYNPDTGFFDDTWEWDGLAWTQRQPEHRPSARNGHAMVYDASRGRTVLYGGFNGSYLGDTWEWDGADWTQIAGGGPGLRAEHAMTYDETRERVVLFGGYNDETANADTWEWDGATWTRVATEGPPRRVNHSMAYDAVRGRVVLFGGSHVIYEGEPEPSPAYLDDTWEWNGTSWTQIQATGPVRRVGHRLFFDRARQRVVLFGGESDDVPLADTWLWDGAQWTEVQGAGGTARLFFDIAYDTTGRTAILFGGRTNSSWLGDTWDWR